MVLLFMAVLRDKALIKSSSPRSLFPLFGSFIKRQTSGGGTSSDNG